MKTILYRGDFEKIDRFDFDKTHKYCLVGQGIYLTDSRVIASSYRTKDSSEVTMACLFNKEAANRNEAFEKAFLEFCKIKHQQLYGYGKYPIGKKQEKFECSLVREYRQLIEDNIIKAEYCNSFGFSRFGHRIEKKTIKVIWEIIKNPGYLSMFEFDTKYLDNNIIHTDTSLDNKDFWELMFVKGIKIGKEASNVSDYIDMNNGTRVSEAIKTFHSDKALFKRDGIWAKIRQVLEPYGIIGFEYNGGQRLGYKNHRAFCIWDDELVNSCRVSVLK